MPSHYYAALDDRLDHRSIQCNSFHHDIVKCKRCTYSPSILRCAQSSGHSPRFASTRRCGCKSRAKGATRRGIRGSSSQERVAEREGFEPSSPVKSQHLSRVPRSATPAPLRIHQDPYPSRNVRKEYLRVQKNSSPGGILPVHGRKKRYY